MSNFYKTIKKSLLVAFLAFSCGFMLLPLPSQAALIQLKDIQFQPQVGIPGSQFTTGGSVTLSQSTKSIGDYIQAIYNYGVGVVGILAAIIMMIAGAIWITAAGNETKISEAKEWMGAAFAGMALVLLSYMMFRIINPNLVDLKIQNVTIISGQEAKGNPTILNSLDEAPQDIRYGYVCLGIRESSNNNACGDTNPPSIQLNLNICRTKYGSGPTCDQDSDLPIKACCGLSDTDKAQENKLCEGKTNGTPCAATMTAEAGKGYCLNNQCAACKYPGTSCSENLECKDASGICGSGSSGDCAGGFCSFSSSASENQPCGPNNEGKCLSWSGAYACPGNTQASGDGGTSCASGLKCCK